MSTAIFTGLGGVYKSAPKVDPAISSERLPPGVYDFDVKKTMQGIEFSFVRRNIFALPAKLFGETELNARRILKAYTESDKNLGVLSSGVGGTGKSLLAKYVSTLAIRELGMSVVCIGRDNFEYLRNAYDIMSTVNQNIVFYLDEYDKYFDGRSDKDFNQVDVLSLLDGVGTSKHLFLLTANKVEKLNEHLLNRPSRLRYWFTYGHLNRETIRAVIDERVSDKARADEIYQELVTTGGLTYDIIIEFVKECQLFPDVKVSDLMKGFNFKSPPIYLHSYGKITAVINGKSLLEFCEEKGHTTIHGFTDSRGHYELTLAQMYDKMRKGKSAKIDDYVYRFTSIGSLPDINVGVCEVFDIRMKGDELFIDVKIKADRSRFGENNHSLKRSGLFDTDSRSNDGRDEDRIRITDEVNRFCDDIESSVITIKYIRLNSDY